MMFDVSYIDTKKVLGEVGIIEWQGEERIESHDITIINREKNTTTYSELPKTLNQYGGFIDIRHHKQRGLLTDRSKTGLEALACGLKVLTPEGWITSLPERHKPEIVVKNLIAKYEEVLALQ